MISDFVIFFLKNGFGELMLTIKKQDYDLKDY